MEATFKVSAAEFDAAFIDKVKGFLSLVEDGYVTVSIRDEASLYSDKLLKSKAEMESGKETREEYFARLDKAIENTKQGKGVIYNEEELAEFSKSILNEP